MKRALPSAPVVHLELRTGDLKKATTRHRLMKVALRLFEQQGFDGTTVEEIAAGADVAPRTFFRYYPRKEDALFGDHPEEVALIRDTLATRSAGESVVEALRRGILAGVEKVVADPSLFLTRSRPAASVPPMRAVSISTQVRGRHRRSGGRQPQGRSCERPRGRSDRNRRVERQSRGARHLGRKRRQTRPPAARHEAFDLLEHGLRQT
jgi:AcrR family transcriptional regulator